MTSAIILKSPLWNLIFSVLLTAVLVFFLDPEVLYLDVLVKARMSLTLEYLKMF